MDGGVKEANGGGKGSEEEFELARTNFEKTSAVLEKLIKSISKIADSFKVSMWAVIDLSDLMKEFLGAGGPPMQLESFMNEYMKDVGEQVNSMNGFYEQHKAFRTMIEEREKLCQQNKTANSAKTRAALDKHDVKLKNDLTSHHYSRCRRVAPELHKYVQTQMKLFNRVNESMSDMSEFLAKKCRGEEDLEGTVGRNSLKKSSRRDKSLGGSSGAVPTSSLSSSLSATHSPTSPSSPVPPPRARPGTMISRDPPPIPPKNRAGTTSSATSRSHIGGKASATAPPSLSKIYRRSLSQQNLVNKKLSEISGDDEYADKEERSHSVDDGKELANLRSALIDSGMTTTLTSSDKKVTIPAPSYPRPQGVAPPPSRPVSTQVTKEDVEAERIKDPTKFRRQLPIPGGPRGLASGPLGLPASPSLSSSLISSVALPSLSVTASAQSSEELHTGGSGGGGGGSPTGSSSPVSASPPPIPSALAKPKNTLTRALSAAEDPQWAQQPRKAKGTTGVTPTVVAERRQYWRSLDGRPT